MVGPSKPAYTRTDAMKSRLTQTRPNNDCAKYGISILKACVAGMPCPRQISVGDMLYQGGCLAQRVCSSSCVVAILWSYGGIGRIQPVLQLLE